MRKLLFIHSRTAVLVVIVLALTACSMGSQTEIERNREKWQNSGITHYRYSLFVGCFCPFGEDMPLNIEVQNGEVVSMEYQSGKAIEDSNRELFRSYETIDHIFSELERYINGEAEEVVVTYDPTYGFPAQVNIDFIKNATDDEQSLTISGFEKLP